MLIFILDPLSALIVAIFLAPLSNLDARLRIEVRGFLKELQRRIRTTIIHVTHDQEEALAIAEEIVVMNRGLSVEVGYPDLDRIVEFVERAKVDILGLSASLIRSYKREKPEPPKAWCENCWEYWRAHRSRQLGLAI